MQPYNSNHNNAGMAQSKVRINGQLFDLNVTKENLILSQDTQSEPYIYPISTIESANRIENEYYEPCIEIKILYDDGSNASMVMIFDFEDIREQIFSDINYFLDISRRSVKTQEIYQEYDKESYNEYSKDHYTYQSENQGGYKSDFEAEYIDNSSGKSGHTMDFQDEYDDTEHSRSFQQYKYSSGELSFIEKIIAILKNPEDIFPSLASDDILPAFIHMTLVLTIFSVVTALSSAIISSFIAPELGIFGNLLKNIPGLIILIIELLVFGIISVFVYGILVFLIAKIAGEEQVPEESLVVTMYSATPFGILGLIPLFGAFLSPLGMVFIQYKGMTEGLYADQIPAIMASVIPAIIMFGLFYYFIISGEVAYI
ncbi:YIP1 family protein [Methanoplanus sp. FWC-SCC4]|uniref:YIP1 family protein n=1 Tax=Methanochimaera problematica TaxID=2609417 RepID=A0AA97FEI3_9EURY|nr:Yip1 family protein [Methanoplanus sp. FWC-SCC4]WOF15966.1 YIP1 family protein [Methanoplanus sp. FWC-SCC4]